MKYLLLFICLGLSATLQAQTDRTEAQINTLITNSTAISGDMYHDTDNDLYYMGLDSGGLQLVSDFIALEISNEQLFENANYIYISMQKGTNAYVVNRYDKSDVNQEDQATGTGAQPSDLASVEALTYN
jgi:hypothetical protein